MTASHDIFSAKELIHLFIDGEITDVERGVLFNDLASSTELQEYMADAIRSNQFFEQSRNAAVPEHLHSSILSSAFGNNSSLDKLLQPTFAHLLLRYGVAASMAAAILTGGVNYQNTSPLDAPLKSENQKNMSNADGIVLQRFTNTQTHNFPEHAASVANWHVNNLNAATQQLIKSESLPNISAQDEPHISASIEKVEIINNESLSSFSVPYSSASTSSATSIYAKQTISDPKDIAVTLGGFGTSASFTFPTRLSVLRIISNELSVGLQYNARSYNIVVAKGAGIEINPMATGYEAIVQYKENSDILPLGLKPTANFAAGYSRLGPTAFMFAGVSSEIFDVVSLQTGIEGNALFYEDHSSRSVAGGLRFTINAGVQF